MEDENYEEEETMPPTRPRRKKQWVMAEGEEDEGSESSCREKGRR